MALDLQAKLLRVLEGQSFERLGSTRSSHVNVRLLAATNRDLPAMARAPEFRADLYYRLNVFPISLPPLGERVEDIRDLVCHFVTEFSRRMGKAVDQIPHEILQAIAAYDWPGNIRELQNFIERGVILSTGRVFHPTLDQLLPPANGSNDNAQGTVEDATRRHILQTLRAANWVVGGPNGAAARLGLARTTLLAKMRRLGIESVRRERHSGSVSADNSEIAIRVRSVAECRTVPAMATDENGQLRQGMVRTSRTPVLSDRSHRIVCT